MDVTSSFSDILFILGTKFMKMVGKQRKDIEDTLKVVLDAIDFFLSSIHSRFS